MSCGIVYISVKEKLISKICDLNSIDFEYYSYTFPHTAYLLRSVKYNLGTSVEE